MIISDYHVHTSFSSDSDAPAASQINALIAKGITKICITDHIDPGYPDGEFCLDADAYYSAMRRFSAQYSDRAEIAVGIELGLRTDFQSEITSFAAAKPWEFIIGSTHVADGLDPYYPEYWTGKTKTEGIRRYYENTLANVKLYDCFDVYGHIDYIIRYAPGGPNGYSWLDYRDIIDELLRTLISKGKGIECNSAGLKYGLSNPNPEPAILSRYRELGGEILTIGSDGHTPEHVAFDFDKLPEMLKACGFKYYTIFRDRKPKMLPL